MTEWSNVSDCNSGGFNTYGGSNPPAAPLSKCLDDLWKEWLKQKHDGKLIQDRAWLHLDHPTLLVSSLVRTVDWHIAPGIWGLNIWPIRGYTSIEYPTKCIKINTPQQVHTNTLHRWIPSTPGNVFLAEKLNL